MAKVLIHVLDRKTLKKDYEISVLYYPSQYTQEMDAIHPDVEKLGRTKRIQFAGRNPETLSMNLFFDTYSTGEDVRIHTNKITNLMEYDSKGNPPPVLMIVWGKMNFTCVLEHVSKTFTMFLQDGVPVRATLDCRFKEYRDEIAPQASPTSEGQTKTQTVKSGDSLSSIASDAYGDPSKWRDIAEENNISNPRVLDPGKEITIPPS